MKKNKSAFVICSAIALGSLILPLASCKDDKTPTEAACKVEFYTDGTAKDKVSVLYDKTTFEPGDVLTFQIKTEENVAISDIVFNDQPLIINEKNEYKVTLRKGINRISVVAMFTGTVQPTIDADAVLLFEDGKEYPLTFKNNRFESLDIEVPKKQRFGIYLKNGDSYIPYSSISYLNTEHTFAGIDNSPINSGPYRDMSLKIEGGATYKFYYDEYLENPLYVVRSKVSTYPSDVNQLRSLLNNGLLSGQTYNTRTDLKEATFHLETALRDGTPYKETSTYKHYQNDVSVSEFTINDSKTKDMVYNQIKDGVLLTVDTLNDKVASQPDSEPISYKNKIVEEKSGYTRYLKTLDEAKFLVSQPVRDAGNVGIASSFVVYETSGSEDGIKVSSKKEGTNFVTTVHSRKIREGLVSTASKLAYVSDGTFTFREDGTLLSAKLFAKKYDDTAYDFDKLEVKQGKEDAYTTGLDLSASYTYGLSSLEVSPYKDEDINKYFVQSIDKVTIRDNGNAQEGNIIYPKTVIDFDSTDSSRTMKLEVSPKDALDIHQYGVISSSNTKVIEKDGGSYRNFIAKKQSGVSTLTIGNYADNKVSSNVDVTVNNTVRLRYVFISDPYSPINYPYADPRMETKTHNALLMAETKHVIRLASSPDSANIDNLAIKKISGSLIENHPEVEQAIKLSIDEDKNLLLTIDLSAYRMPINRTTPETFKVEFTGADIEEGGHYTDSSSDMTFTVMPKVMKRNIIGTWHSYVYDKNKKTDQIKATIIIEESKITVIAPKAFQALEINKENAVFELGKKYATDKQETWDFYPGYYCLNVAGTNDYSDPKEATGFDFTSFYYNPYTKNIEATLLFSRWAGLEAETASILGTYADSSDSTVPDVFELAPNLSTNL